VYSTNEMITISHFYLFKEKYFIIYIFIINIFTNSYINVLYISVAENTESIENPLHEAAKRGKLINKKQNKF